MDQLYSLPLNKDTSLGLKKNKNWFISYSCRIKNRTKMFCFVIFSTVEGLCAVLICAAFEMHLYCQHLRRSSFVNSFTEEIKKGGKQVEKENRPGGQTSQCVRNKFVQYLFNC